jgi:hypothetical protein
LTTYQEIGWLSTSKLINMAHSEKFCLGEIKKEDK